MEVHFCEGNLVAFVRMNHNYILVLRISDGGHPGKDL